MKYFATLLLLCGMWTMALAQVDTLQYDGIKDVRDGNLIAVTQFPGELDVIFNARFTPAEKCTLHTVLVGFSVVKFQALTGNDTLIVLVYENGTVPPKLVNLQKTYKVNLGENGFPSPNIRFQDPLQSGARDVLAVKLDPPVIFSPKREFIIGVKLQSLQRYAAGEGLWNGFTLLASLGNSEYERYRRYMITPRESRNRNPVATQGAEAALFIRAIVGYNPDLPPIDPVDVENMPAPGSFLLEQNYPNPFNPSTTLSYALTRREHIHLAVIDALGREVAVLADGMMDAGMHDVRFDAGSLAGGLYIARLTANGRSQTRKMLLMK